MVTALGLAGGIWVVLSAITDIAERLRLFRVPLGASLARLVALPRAAIGATLGHIGFGVTVLGIAGMTLATQKVIVLQPGQTTELGGYDWTLDDIHDAPRPELLPARRRHHRQRARPSLPDAAPLAPRISPRRKSPPTTPRSTPTAFRTSTPCSPTSPPAAARNCA